MPELTVPSVRRRISLDNQQDLHTWLTRALPELSAPMRSSWLQRINKTLMARRLRLLMAASTG